MKMEHFKDFVPKISSRKSSQFIKGTLVSCVVLEFCHFEFLPLNVGCKARQLPAMFSFLQGFRAQPFWLTPIFHGNHTIFLQTSVILSEHVLHVFLGKIECGSVKLLSQGFSLGCHGARVTSKLSFDVMSRVSVQRAFCFVKERGDKNGPV